MLVIMTAHSQVNKVEDPEHLTFDQHDLKLHKKQPLCVVSLPMLLGMPR